MVKRQNLRKTLILLTFFLFPVTFSYASPYLIIISAASGVVNASFVIFSLLFLFSMFFGRGWCGYICSAGGLQECLIMAQPKKTKGGKLYLIKYFIWIPWLITILFLFIKAGGIKRIDFFININNGISISGPTFLIIIYYTVVSIFTVLSLFAGKRAGCHYLCWMAPFMVIGIKTAKILKIPTLHLKTNKTQCIGCNKCSEKCPMSLDVKDMVKNEKMINSECILCGECIDICSKKAITYSFKK